MAGRWRLVSANGAACGMNFTAPIGAVEGAIAPEGGCPGNFFMSRRWLFEQDSLVVQDHNRKPLVRMKQGPAGRFEGEAANREFVWLER
ncbi:MAG: AprI/Inh family metalloprotease inhibitor [Xanthobacteraceae bacterium]